MAIYNVNALAILLGGVSYMLIGILWYSPMLFGNQWMKLMGLTGKKLDEMKKNTNMTLTYGGSLFFSLVQTFVLGYLLYLTGMSGIQSGLLLGFLGWFGFANVTMLTNVFYGGKSLQLYALDTAYQLVTLLAMGAIVGYFA